MKNKIGLVIASLALCVSAQAGNVQGYKIPDRLEAKAKASLQYIANNSDSDLAGTVDVKNLREIEIKKLAKMPKLYMTKEEQIAADASYGLSAAIVRAYDLNKENTAKSRKELKELAQDFLNK